VENRADSDHLALPGGVGCQSMAWQSADFARPAREQLQTIKGHGQFFASASRPDESEFSQTVRVFHSR
jgi:hypothetical protein